MIKERPILFSAPMIRAILEGRKTQTRRAIKLPKERGVWEPSIVGGRGVTFSDGTPCEEMPCIWNTKTGKLLLCPHGKIGDRLWVRESLKADGDYMVYAADGARIDCGDMDWPSCIEKRKTIPSIHMPRWASRILLEITNVRAERLNNISEADAVAEGIKQYVIDTRSGDYVNDTYAIDDFRHLWESINGQGSWDLNPWVWVIEFKVINSKGES